MDSKLGKRKSRKLKQERINNEVNKYRKPISIISISLLVFAGIIYAFFSKALDEGFTRDHGPVEYKELTKTLKATDWTSHFLNYQDRMEEERALGEDSEIKPRKRWLHSGLLASDIKYYLRKEGIDPSQIGFAYYNLENSTYLGINEDEEFFAASTSKVPLVMFLYDLAGQDKLDLDAPLMVKAKHMEAGTGIIQEGRPGSVYRLRDLGKLAITHSDNVATNMLYTYLSERNREYALDSLANLYGISTYEGNYMTADEAIVVLDKLYKNKENNPYYFDLLDHMKHTVYNNYFTKKIGVKNIGHKTGEFEKSYNDIGIVYDHEPYAFAIYTRDLEDPVKVLNDLGYIVHQWHIGAAQ